MLASHLDKAEAELSMIYENQIPKVPAPLWIIHDPEKLVKKKELKIISRAEQSLFIIGGFMFEDEALNLKQSLNNAIKKGVNTRIVNNPYSIINDTKIDIAQELAGLKLSMESGSNTIVKLVVRDDQEMLIAFSKLSCENTVSEDAVGIWNQYFEFVETISSVYG